MMSMKPKFTGMFSPARGARTEGDAVLEMRPGGMFVQKRNSDADHSSIPVPTIKVKVKYGSSYLEFNISSQASFGDLKKMVAGPTGLHHEEQKLIFKEKERESRTFLDVAGVKNGSKIVLIEDDVSREKRFLESRKTAKMDKASKEISEISLEVDKLAKQVANLETQIYGGKRVLEKTLSNLIEQLMTLLIKLDGIVADGDVKLKRRLQVKRVQNYIEALDMLKIKNSMIGNGASKIVPMHLHQNITAAEMHMNPTKMQQQMNHRNIVAGDMLQPVVVTTNWETFDSGLSAKAPFNSSASTPKRAYNNASPKPSWEYFV